MPANTAPYTHTDLCQWLDSLANSEAKYQILVAYDENYPVSFNPESDSEPYYPEDN